MTAASIPPLAIAALFGSILTIGAGNSIAQTLFSAIGPEGAVGLRNLVGAAVLLEVYRPSLRMSRREWITVAGYGMLLGLMNELFYRSLLTLPIGLSVAIEFTGPLLVTVLASRRRSEFFWVVLAAIGIALITPEVSDRLAGPARSALRLDWHGIIYALAAGAAWAGYMLLGQRAGASHGGGAAALGLAMATLITLPIALARHGAALFAPAIWPTAIAVGLLAGAIPYALEIYALARMPARNYGMLVSTEPAVSGLMGYVLLGQQLSGLQMLAIALLITASAGATLGTRRNAPVLEAV
ncbi:inner membrane transporter RhtA [Endobacter medicaginis]|uniref:Inner membrane transporter RhtA n=2 Tax=Endobacter medicaginis TaxID=1181271 RepID=A0A839V0B5_9PROT|nr:EamA family transporter [Endobacter medicaginis]MBB3172989.1 inner membrane transporter RhtA [Endobacter medicaginis]MCX5475231.1 EamA family transporter [Endobacter medicaginis]